MTPFSTTPRAAVSSSSKPPRGGSGPSRSLTTALALGGADYFEAVFKDGNDEYHRVAWRKDETARVWLPPGDPATLVTPLKLAGTPILTSAGYATEGNLPSRADPQTGGPGAMPARRTTAGSWLSKARRDPASRDRGGVLPLRGVYGQPGFYYT
ncbi:MAG: hypothetical protein LBG84_01040 [Treponema sp.]|jgi:hypothetical protein|nr:hypothetical protein [Treponema sp.]